LSARDPTGERLDRLACARLLESGVETALTLGHLDEAERLCGQLEETAAAGWPCPT